MGLVCGWGSGTRLVQMFGRTLALELLTTGKIFGWKEAMDLNFVDGIIPEQGDPYQSAKEWLMKWCAGDTQVIRATKKMISEISDSDMEIQLAKENNIFASVWGGPAQQDALSGGIKHK